MALHFYRSKGVVWSNGEKIRGVPNDILYPSGIRYSTHNHGVTYNFRTHFDRNCRRIYAKQEIINQFFNESAS